MRATVDAVRAHDTRCNRVVSGFCGRPHRE